MAADRSAIVSFLNTFLDVASIRDSSWNGLQVEGAARVRRAAFAVDAGSETFVRAAEAKADFLVVHHGLFWEHADPSIAGYTRRRVEVLWKHGISLYASHLPLDRHRTAGNNARLIGILGARIADGFARHEGQTVGWTGTFARPVPAARLVKRLERALNVSATFLPFGPRAVRTVGVCSGGGGYSTFAEALAGGLDLYVTGDAIEIYHAARDAGLNVVFAGHHATETLGVKALAEVVARRFRVETEFIDIPTGL